MSIPAIMAGIQGVSTIAGLLNNGGGRPSNPYMPLINNYMGAAGKQAGNIANLGNEANNTYGEFSPQANTAIEDYSKYLQQNPYTSAYSTALLNQATKGTTTAYQQAQSQLQADMTARGLGQSGMLAGGDADLMASRANTIGSGMFNVGMDAIANQGTRMAENADLLSGAANNAYGQASSNYGAAGSLYKGIGDTYGQLGNEQEAYNMDYNNQQAQEMQNLGSGLSGALGNYYYGQLAQKNSNALQNAYNGGGVAPPVTPGGGSNAPSPIAPGMSPNSTGPSLPPMPPGAQPGQYIPKLNSYTGQWYWAPNPAMSGGVQQ